MSRSSPQRSSSQAQAQGHRLQPNHDPRRVVGILRVARVRDVLNLAGGRGGMGIEAERPDGVPVQAAAQRDDLLGLPGEAVGVRMSGGGAPGFSGSAHSIDLK